MPTQNKKVRQLAGVPNLIPPRKTAGFCCTKPMKKPPSRATKLWIIPKWCDFTNWREPIFRKIIKLLSGSSPDPLR